VQESEVLALLRAFTADLQPGDAGAEALEDARRHLAVFLRDNPQPIPPGHSSVGQTELLESQLRLAACEAEKPVAAEQARFTMVRRDQPSAISWLAAGQQPVRVFGPFLDGVGRHVWFDLFLLADTLQIAWTSRPGIALVLPSAAIPAGATRIEFGPGSVWIEARLLTAAAPANAYAGWKVQNATLELSAAGTLSGNTLTLPAQATCRLIMAPDNSETNAPEPGPGADAGQTSVTRPAEANLSMTASGLTSFQAGPAKIEILTVAAALVRMEAPPVYNQTLERIWIPFGCDVAESNLIDASTLSTVAGPGIVKGAGWCPALSRSKPEQLGDAGSGGMIVLDVDGAITASGEGLKGGSLRLGRTYLLADRGFAGVLSPAAANPSAVYSISLPGDSTIQLGTEEPFAFLFLSSRTGIDVVQYRGMLAASLAEPLLANGSRVPVRFANATLTLSQTTAGLSAFGAVATQSLGKRTALALSNGLFTVTNPLQFDFQAELASASVALSGTVQLLFGVYQLLPILPDPYAANFGPDRQADAPRGRLKIAVSLTGNVPELTFQVLSEIRNDGSPQIGPAPAFTPVSDTESERLRGIFHEFVHDRFSALGRLAVRDLRMLDVSTNADQLGIDIGYSPGVRADIEVNGVDIVSLGGRADVLMLPQMQWEPVQIIENLDVGKLPKYFAHPDDGGPTLVGARTVRLTPVAPIPLVDAVVDAHNDASERTGAFFTLPFGIRALATLNPARTPLEERAEIRIFRKAFVQDFTSATQVRLKAAPARLRLYDLGLLPTLVREPPMLHGAAVQTVHAKDQFNTPIEYTPPPPPAPQVVVKKFPPFSVLDPIDQDFNLTFGPGSPDARVPIERVDLSGYGASCFSDWWHDQPSGITNVRFEVLCGRTRYEVIRMKTILGPCAAVLVRTITLERRASGNVFRWDSGWQPVTDGLFDWPDATVKQHTGPIRGFYNIRHIRDTPGTITIDGGKAEVQVVYFDTDIEVDHAVKGATSGKRVPSIGQIGFVQRIPKGLAPPTFLNAKQFQEVLEKLSPIGGPFDCVVNIGGSGQEMRLTSTFCAPAPRGAGMEFAVACYGSLSVPRNEQWSVIQINNGNDVGVIDAHKGVPLIRAGGTKRIPPSGNYRIADPQDLFNETPGRDYGLLLTTRTNRLLFPRPEIPDSGTSITGKLEPILADPYSLTGVGGPFPPIRRCLHLKAKPYKLDLVGGVFRWTTPAGGLDFTIPDLGAVKKRFLVKSNTFDMFVDYANKVEIAANQLKPWGINIPKVPAALDVKTPIKADSIVQVLNDLPTPDIDGLPVPNSPQILFGGILKDAKEVITALEKFLPGTPPITVDLSTPRIGDPGLRLLITARFPIAKADGSAIDIGIGKFRGEIGVGTEVRLALTGFGGRIFFIVGGELQQPLLPKIAYVGGSMTLELSIDEKGTPVIRLVTSAVASVGGDLIPGLVELEGSVSYGAFLDTSHDPFLPGVALGMELRAKLLSGFVGVRFRADAAVGIKPLGGGVVRDILIQGQFRAMGSVIAAWGLVEEDFEKTLRFEQKVPGLVAGAFLVATGIVPVPV
jgi:hypothetical protein